MFPDQHHIDQVRKALWSQPGAGVSVIVGSGFSRNAQALVPGSRPLPLLEEIAVELARTLHSEDDSHIADNPSTSRPPSYDASGLAQEYRSEFGKDALHDRLCSLVPDADFAPGDAHKRLLRLPWADAFTTNWDTLLERESTDCTDPSYAVVRAAGDIPGKSRPRIIKLHGTIPDPPLIITSEDYRRYQDDFAPLAHTVRQAMMETVFLLLGFSGNDLNFREWSGWVRDELADSSPHIYVVGYLDLSGPTRRTLTKQNIVPIDLARHPIANDWAEHNRHERATEWILSTLESRPRQLPERSVPRDRPVRVDGKPLVAPIVAKTAPEPEDEPLEPPPPGSIEDPLKSVKEVLVIWAHNRKRYLGWLVPPARLRQNLRISTERWTPLVVEVLPSLSPLPRLSAVRELVWRYERSLIQIPDELRAVATDTLASIDCRSQTVEGSPDGSRDWNLVRRSWQHVALALLTAARYRFDSPAFDELLRALAPVAIEDVEARHRVRHERCLWALWSLDFESLTKDLDEWTAEGGDPAWKMRKSALLRELGREDEASELIERAREEAKAMPVSELDVRGPSREGWALWSVASLSKIDVVRQRWNELAAANCDPSMEIEWLVNALTESDRNTVTPNFDLGVSPSEPLPSSTALLEAAAYRSIRLTEIAGIPQAVDYMSISGHMLKRASERLAICDPCLAIHLMLRVARYDKDEALLRVLSRERVAALPRPLAEALSTATRTGLRYAMSRIEGAGASREVLWAERARVLMEAASRLALRLDEDSAESLLDDALSLYDSPAVASEIWLHEALGSMFSRCWESLSDARRRDRSLDLMDAPIVGVDGPHCEWSGYPDPGQVVSIGVLPRRSAGNEERWQAIVERIISGLSSEGMARERAARRLVVLALSGRLKEDESARTAKALWSSSAEHGDELPQETPIFDYAFILLPEPSAGMGRRAFGRKWISGDVGDVSRTGLMGPGSSVGLSGLHTSPANADDIVWQVGLSIPFLRRHGGALQLTAEEGDYLTAVIERWADTNLRFLRRIPDLVQHERAQSLRGACRGLSWILTEMQIPTSLAEKLYDKVPDLNDFGVLAFSMLPGIAKTLPDRIGDISELMSAGLMSDDRQIAQNVVVTLHRWIIWAADSTLGMVPVPEHLVRDIGISIVARRRPVLVQALDCAKWILGDGSDKQRESIRDLTIRGLGDLIEELRYDREDASDGSIDVPLARLRSIEVARALANEGREGDPAVRRWLEMGMDDPLPEVRRAAESWHRKE